MENVINFNEFRERAGKPDRNAVAAKWMMEMPISEALRSLLVSTFALLVENDDAATPVGLGAKTDVPGMADIRITFMDATGQYLSGTCGWRGGFCFSDAHLLSGHNPIDITEDHVRDATLRQILADLDQLTAAYPAESHTTRAFMQGLFLRAVDRTGNFYRIDNADGVVFAMLIAEGEFDRPELFTLQILKNPILLET